MAMSLDNIALGASILFALVGVVFAARGAARTQSALQRVGTHDVLIDTMAWIDRHVLTLQLLRRDIRDVGAQVRDSGDRIEQKVDLYGEQHARQLDEIRAELQRLTNAARSDAYSLPHAFVVAFFARFGLEPPASPEALLGAFEALAERLSASRASLSPQPEDDAAIVALKAEAAAASDSGVNVAAALRPLLDKVEERVAERKRGLVPLLRELAAIQQLTFDHDRAKKTLEELVALNPTDARRRVDLGDLWRLTGSLDKALEAYRSAQAAAERSGDERDLSISHEKIGDVLVAQGEREMALAAYRRSLAIAETLASRDPGNTLWQRDLSVSHDRIGNVLVAQGERGEALDAYRKSLAIAETLASRDPGNAEWQRDLNVSEVDPAAAPRLLARALEIAQRLEAEGRLAPVDAGMPGDLARRLAALKPG